MAAPSAAKVPLAGSMSPTLSLPALCAWANGTLRKRPAARAMRVNFMACLLLDVGTKECLDACNQGIRLVAVGRVAAVGQFEQLGMRHTARDAANLLQRAVFIVQPLHRQKRTADGADLFFDRPVLERRVQPDAVPAPERGVWIVVI